MKMITEYTSHAPGISASNRPLCTSNNIQESSHKRTWRLHSLKPKKIKASSSLVSVSFSKTLDSSVCSPNCWMRESATGSVKCLLDAGPGPAAHFSPSTSSNPSCSMLFTPGTPSSSCWTAYHPLLLLDAGP
ncbi:hypothetical protein LR48_Vigan44s000300 [Vigna angularis]|uniref:Uncharacterized protein n=1 Tax=Phaseolus angularis TaxID=3914 RepID=A0A0L9T329_PHAAN|nr:hypothetical protein LR48_Vigan44s000300 [Vigna angularis]